MIGWNVYGLAEEPPFNALVICRWDQLVSMEPRLPKQGMDGTAESITWNLVSAIIGPTLRTSYMLLMVYSCTAAKPATSMEVPVIRFRGISSAWSVLARTRFKDAPVLTNSFCMWTSLIRAMTYKGLL